MLARSCLSQAEVVVTVPLRIIVVGCRVVIVYDIDCDAERQQKHIRLDIGDSSPSCPRRDFDLADKRQMFDIECTGLAYQARCRAAGSTRLL